MAVPKLRFKEFDGDWTLTTLNQLSTKIGDGIHATPKYDESGTIPFINGNNLVNGRIAINENTKRISSEEFQKYNQILSDRTLFLSINGTIGNLAFYKNEKVLLGKSVCFINLKNDLDKKFIYLLLQSPQLTKTLNSELTGTTIKNLSLATVRNSEFYCPIEAEQTKIASFLSAVDEKITQLTQKHQLLSQYKQGMMQKLFNQQIRFKADDGSEFGEWEDKTISDIASYRRGSFPQPYGLPEWLDENGFPFVQVYDVAENMLLKDKTKIKISQLAANQSVLAKAGTLIITLQGSIGRVAKMQYDAYVDRALLIFQSYAMPIDTDYFKYALYLLFNIEKEKADGGIIKTITKETLSKFNIGIPCLEEQTKIANFLSAIDQKIEVTEQQIEQAKQWKKGLLQQMFV